VHRSHLAPFALSFLRFARKALGTSARRVRVRPGFAVSIMPFALIRLLYLTGSTLREARFAFFIGLAFKSGFPRHSPRPRSRP
jgi:hypothetical protein